MTYLGNCASAPGVLATHTNTLYAGGVPEKKGTGLGRLIRKKRTDRAMRFFFVRMPSYVSYERRWWGRLRACWFFFFHQSANPAICRSPRLAVGRGLTVKKETSMSSTSTSVHFQHEQIQRLAKIASTIGEMLAGLDILNSDGQSTAFALSATLAQDLAKELAESDGVTVYNRPLPESGPNLAHLAVESKTIPPDLSARQSAIFALDIATLGASTAAELRALLAAIVTLSAGQEVVYDMAKVALDLAAERLDHLQRSRDIMETRLGSIAGGGEHE
jgi:hypothetical protein